MISFSSFPGAPADDSNPEDWTDTECVMAAKAMRRDRLNIPNMTVPRVVRGLARLDYEMTVAEYKELERVPFDHVELIRSGVIQLVYRVLTGDLPAYRNSDKYTQSVMALIKEAREAEEYSYADMAEMISNRGAQITEDEYRTMEQGITKHVPVSVVFRACQSLGIGSVPIRVTV
jgi:hypothetical protein